MAENIVILGSGPAGLTAAIYCARANLSPLVLEGRDPGGQLMITSDVENYPGFALPIGGPELMAAMRAQAERVGARFQTGEVTSTDLKRRPFVLELDGQKIEAKTLIIATGARARWIGLESETALRGKGVSGCATCDGFFFKGKEVAVVGGGDTAVEDAIYLTHVCSKVTLIHRRDELRACKLLQERARKNQKIEFVWNAVVDEVLDVSKGEVTGVRVRDVKSGALREIPCQGVFVAIGYTPSTGVFKGQLEMSPDGYILTPKTSTQTSVAGVFAAGDCQDPVYRQAIVAAGTGCMAATDAERCLQEQC